MKLCRFDEDRLGVVVANTVHDVTSAQDEIRKTARYDMKGDAVIAALPSWRQRFEEMAARAPAKPLSEVKLISPVARPSKANQPAFDLAVEQVSAAAHALLDTLVTNAPPSDRETEAAKARARSAERFRSAGAAASARCATITRMTCMERDPIRYPCRDT